MKLILQSVKSLLNNVNRKLEKLPILQRTVDQCNKDVADVRNSFENKLEVNNPIYKGSFSAEECEASGESSHAEGWHTKASGKYSHAEGYCTEASGEYTHAEGSWTKALRYGAHAEGTNTEARDNYSHAEGFGTIATGSGSHVQGKCNIVDEERKYAHIVGNGTGMYGDSRSNAHTLDWDGNAWFAGYVEGTAIILSSPSGKRFKVTVTDTGSLTATELTA